MWKYTLREKFRVKKEEVTGDFEQLRTEKVCNL
jgi:hypothetical protein